MKLHTKFSLVIGNLAVVMSLILITILFFVAKFVEANRFERELFDSLNKFQGVVYYSNSSLLSSAKIDKMYDDMSAMVAEIKDNKEKIVRYKGFFINPETNKKFDDLLIAWDAIEVMLSSSLKKYQQISQINISDYSKKLIEYNGLFLLLMSDNFSLDLSSKVLVPYVREIHKDVSQINPLLAELDAVCTDTIESISHTVDILWKNFVSISLIVSLLAIGITYNISEGILKKIVKRLEKVKAFAAHMAEKDFSGHIEDNGDDEINEMIMSLNHSSDIVCDILGHVKLAASDAGALGETINDSSADAVATTQQINDGVVQFNSVMDDLTVAVDKTVAETKRMIDISTQLISQNIEQSNFIALNMQSTVDVSTHINLISQQAEKRVQNSKDIEEFVVDGEMKIKTTNDLLQNITNQLEEVSGIVSIINGIASKTNMLAMNAAIESAHAGLSGRGFAVVAEEIRVLAESVAKNSHHIKSAIKGITDTVLEANEASKLSSSAFLKVSNRSKEIVHSLDEISDSIKDIDASMHSVNDNNMELIAVSKKISAECSDLSTRQELVSEELDSMYDMFMRSRNGINEIKLGTDDINMRVMDIHDNSLDNCNKMRLLDTSLSEFTTDDQVVLGMTE